MDRDKSRGRDHIKNKKKFKDKSTKDPKHVPQKAVPNLMSNWDRYEQKDVSDVPQLNSSTDFSILANAPISQGHHFQFKSDKFIEEEREDKMPNNFFSLDLSMLEASILTVPFYKRIGIEEDCFEENQIKFMSQKANDNLVKYNEKYSTNQTDEEKIKPTCKNIVVETSKDIQEEILVEEVLSRKSENKQEPVIYAEKLEKSISLEEKTDRGERSEEDLEQWLDDILDD